MSEIQQLYQKIILEHARHPYGKEIIPKATVECTLRNPDCGDTLTIYAQVEHEGFQQISFMGTGCIISQASASMMVQSLTGKTISEAISVMHNFQQMLLEKPYQADLLEDLIALESLKQFPTRVRCGTLAWHALETGMQEGGYDFG